MSWSTDDLEDDEITQLSKMVVDLAEESCVEGATVVTESDLLDLVIAAYTAGKRAGALSAVTQLVDPRKVVIQ
jgi:hypothetical protein